MEINAQSLIESQRRWLARHGAEFDGSGRVRDWRENLWAEVSAETQAELAESGLSLLNTGEHKPGELQWPHAPQALLLNAIEPFRSQAAKVAHALGAPTASRIQFAKRLAPHASDDRALEVSLWLDGEKPTAVIARYCEPYEAAPVRDVLTAAALESAASWPALFGARSLGADQRHGPERFESLEVAQLLRFVLALQRDHGSRGFRLCYLWFDGLGLASDKAIEADSGRAKRHRLEIDAFRTRVAGEVDFVSLRFQDLIARLPLSDPHRTYLDDRYFSAHGKG